jgi:hypothetical protein
VKREAFRHPKTLDLAARLGIPHPYAFAHVCYLLNAAADIAPQGNIGKWPNGVIARCGEWLGDPDTFVEALIASGWLDRHRDAQTRLLIHDWPDHAERFVKSKLARERMWFHYAYYVDGTRGWDAPDGIQLAIPNTEPTTDGNTAPPIDATPPCDPTQPNQSKPNPTKPAVGKRAYAAAFEAWYLAYPKHVGKDKAAAAYGRAIARIEAIRKCSTSDAHLWLLDVTQRFAESPAGKSSELPGDLQYVAFPATWLNAGRYNDDPAEWERVRTTAGKALPQRSPKLAEFGL